MIQKSLITLIFCVLCRSSLIAHHSSIILRIGDYSFDVEDFEYVYQKNRIAGHQTLDEFMSLYIPYKLKIVAAKEAGLDTLPEIIDEWAKYRHQLSAKSTAGEAEGELLDGLLLYAMTDSVVWSKAAPDSAGLRDFYKKNARRFRWEKRMDATIYYCSDAKIAERLRKIVHNINEGRGSLPNGLYTFFCDANGISPCVDTVQLKLPKDANTVADRVKWKKGCSKILELNGKFVFLDVHTILRPARKTFEEALGQVISGYQDELEREWVEQLKKKYPVSIDENVWANLKMKYAD